MLTKELVGNVGAERFDRLRMTTDLVAPVGRSDTDELAPSFFRNWQVCPVDRVREWDESCQRRADATTASLDASENPIDDPPALDERRPERLSPSILAEPVQLKQPRCRSQARPQ